MNSNKGINMSIFHKHDWVKNHNDGWDRSEPRERRGDYLPTKWIEFDCKCSARKRIYSDGFTHFGVSDDREFIFYEPFWFQHPIHFYGEWKRGSYKLGPDMSCRGMVKYCLVCGKRKQTKRWW